MFLFYFRDFAIVNFNSSSNFVIEHFRRANFPTVLNIYIYIYIYMLPVGDVGRQTKQNKINEKNKD